MKEQSHLLYVLLNAALISACGNSNPSPQDAGFLATDTGPTDASTDAGSVEKDMSVDAGPPDTGCPPFSHPSDGQEGCATELAWEELPTGPAPRDHHTTFLYAHPGSDGSESATLYVTGGVDEPARRARNNLWYAHVSESGALEDWQQGPTPPVWQSGSGVAIVQNRAYVVSGKTLAPDGRLTETPQVLSLALSEDGVPGAWREEVALPRSSFHGTATAVDNWIFVIGGLETQPAEAAAAVFRAEVMPDGTLSSWTETTPLPEGRSHHATFVHGRQIFVLGGLDGAGVGFPSASYPDYLVAEVNEMGELSQWSRVMLPFEVSTHSAAVVGDRVFLLGGLDGGYETLDTVRMAKVSGSALEDWTVMSPLLFPRAHVHHTPVWRGFVYTVAGNTGSHVPTDRVMVGRLR